LGILRFDAPNWEVDAVACGAHKGLLGPAGIGFLYCKEDLWKEFIPIYTGFSETVSLNRTDEFSFEISDPTDARRFEYGNLNYVGIIGLEAGLNLIQKASVDRIEKWVLNLSRLLNSGLRNLDYQVISSSIPQEQSGIVVVDVPDPADFWDYLKNNGILAMHQKATERIRFSFHAYNNEEEVERILEVASNYDKR
jgi:selenocysteine lyase/cysteine desulfurase